MCAYRKKAVKNVESESPAPPFTVISTGDRGEEPVTTFSCYGCGLKVEVRGHFYTIPSCAQCHHPMRRDRS